MVRIERLLANRGYCGRAQANAFLGRFEVRAEGERVRKGDVRVRPEGVTVEGVAIDPETLLVVMHKPVGVVCSHKDDAGEVGVEKRLVYELLPERWRRRDPVVASVGRLDKETSGLLLLTDDGALLHRLTSPKHHVDRVYLATLDRELRGDEAKTFAAGTLVLKDDDKPLLPAGLEVVGPKVARVTLREGRYHQVRRMFAAVGNHVVTLHRERFGAMTLGGEGGLGVGEYRLVTGEERAGLEGK